MSERITNANIEQAVDLLRRAMRNASIQRTVKPWAGRGDGDDTEFTLTADNVSWQKGSPTYGNAWRIYYVAPSGRRYEMDWSDCLGWSAREALARIQSITAGIDAAVRAARA